MLLTLVYIGRRLQTPWRGTSSLYRTHHQAELERREELTAPEGVDQETIERRRGQLQKLEAGEGLTKLEKISLAEAALEEGVDVYLKRVQER